MIKYSLFIGFLFLVNLPLKAQFINLQIKVEPELSAAVEQPLNFGTQITNSGPTEIALGDLNMGIFSIRAFSNQQVYLELDIPEYLEHTVLNSEENIPLHIEMSYNNSGVNSYQNSTPVTGNKVLVNVANKEAVKSNSDLWNILYLYIFGSIDIGNIPNGIYSGEIKLTITYY